MGSFEAKVTSKGQITLPAQVRACMRIEPGDRVVFTQSPDGTFHVAAKNASVKELRGMIRSGPKVTGGDVQNWIEQARSARMTRSVPKPRLKRSGRE